jgi:hypothetical protein
MASPKKRAAPRGVELIERVIASLEERKAPKPPAPLDAVAIAEMKLANGAPLPPSLQRFLALHGPAHQFPGNWAPGKLSALDHLGVAELIQKVYPKDLLRYFDIGPIVEALPGRCHPIDWDPPLRFLYVGEPDEWGEYPVLVLQDYDDVLDVVVDYPGLDVHLACSAQVVPSPRYYGGIVEDPAYGPMLKAAVKKNFKPMPKLSDKQYRFAAAQ